MEIIKCELETAKVYIWNYFQYNSKYPVPTRLHFFYLLKSRNNENENKNKKFSICTGQGIEGREEMDG